MFRILSPTLSMSVLNVLSKHLGGLPRLPLRLVLTVTDRASYMHTLYFQYRVIHSEFTAVMVAATISTPTPTVCLPPPPHTLYLLMVVAHWTSVGCQRRVMHLHTYTPLVVHPVVLHPAIG